MKVGEKCEIQWHQHPVLTIHSKMYRKDSLLRTPSLPQKSSVKGNIYRDEISTFQARDKLPGFQHFKYSTYC